MNITFSFELNASKNSGKEGSILIRCTQNRKHRRVSTGISVLPKFWDKVHHKIRNSHPLANEYNPIILEKLKKITAEYSKLLADNVEVTIDDLVRNYNSEPITNFFDFAYKIKMAEIKSTNKVGTYRRYDTVLSKFKTFTGQKLNLNGVNYQLLKKYEAYLITELNNSRNTVSANFSAIRAIINEAIRHGIYKGRNPFDQLQLRYTDNTKEKLTVQELYRLIHNPIPPIYSLQLARDFFHACFLAEGTRGGDMIAMKKENIINNCLVFSQQKTGTKMIIPIAQELMTIFKKYVGSGKYIFPMLNNEEMVNEITIGNKLAYINKYLKELAKYSGILKKLSTHVARHTYTDLALEINNGNIYNVQQSLGHSSIKTTELYSRNRVNYNKVSILPEIIEYINKNSGTK
ncbi:MAG: site-specific integrase [Ferruginibacter sp.]